MAELGAGAGSGYPAAVDTKQTFANGPNPLIDSNTRMDSEVLNDALDAIVKVQTELGIAPSGVWASVVARLDAFLAGSVAVPQLIVSGPGPHAIGGATSAGVGLNLLGFTGPSAIDTFGVQLNAPIAVGTPANAATLRIVGAPTGAPNNYALWVVAGNIRHAGQIGRLANTNLGPTVDLDSDAFLDLKGGTTAVRFLNQNDTLELMRLTDSGILTLGTTVMTGAVGGQIVLRNDRAVKGVTSAGNSTRELIHIGSSNQIVLGGEGGVITVGATIVTGAVSGELVLANAKGLRGILADLSGTRFLIHLDEFNNIFIGADTSQDIRWGKPLVALGGGAAPTFGTIGGSGPATAAQNTWMRVLDSSGVAFWVPAWR